MTLGQGQEMTLTINTHIYSLIQLVSAHKLQYFLKKSTVFPFFLMEKPKLQDLTLPLNRSRSTQGHHLKNYDKRESQMRHTKFRGNRSHGSGEDFGRVLITYGCGGHLGNVTSIMFINFHFHVPKSLHAKYC